MNFEVAEESTVRPTSLTASLNHRYSGMLSTHVLLNTEIQPPPLLLVHSSPPFSTKQWPGNCILWPEIKTISFWKLSSLTVHHFGVPPEVKSILSEPFISQVLRALSRAVSQGSQGRAVIHQRGDLLITFGNVFVNEWPLASI